MINIDYTESIIENLEFKGGLLYMQVKQVMESLRRKRDCIFIFEFISPFKINISNPIVKTEGYDVYNSYTIDKFDISDNSLIITCFSGFTMEVSFDKYVVRELN